MGQSIITFLEDSAAGEVFCEQCRGSTAQDFAEHKVGLIGFVFDKHARLKDGQLLSCCRPRGKLLLTGKVGKGAANLLGSCFCYSHVPLMHPTCHFLHASPFMHV